MHARFLSRRHFIAGLGLSAVTAAAFYKLGQSRPRTTLVGAMSFNNKKSFAVGVIQLPGGEIFEIPAPFLGHGFTQSPAQRSRIVMFPHDSTNTACEVDIESRSIVRTFESAGGRHFYGHGTFSPNGDVLYAAENNYAKKESLIVARDARTLEVTGEFPSYGIDPHEMLFLSDGQTVAIANGGLLTDPRVDGGNKALAPVDSSLVFVDFTTQKLLRKIKSDNPGLSFRHLAPLPGGEVAIAVQDKAWGSLPGALLYMSKGGKSIQPVEFTSELRTRANHHSLSVATINGKRIALTSPNGNLITLWDAKTGNLVAQQTVDRCSGVATTGTGAAPLLVSSHSGKLHLLDNRDLRILKELRLRHDDGHWGAHLYRLS